MLSKAVTQDVLDEVFGSMKKKARIGEGRILVGVIHSLARNRATEIGQRLPGDMKLDISDLFQLIIEILVSLFPGGSLIGKLIELLLSLLDGLFDEVKPALEAKGFTVTE